MAANDGATLTEAAARVDELTAAAFALAAVAAALREDETPLTDQHGAVLAELGLAAPRDSGGWTLAPALAELSPPIRRNVAQRLAVVLTRAAAAAEGRLTWAEQDLDVKTRLGQASGIAGGLFVTALAPRLGDLAERLAASGAAVLDVGTGVGAIAAAVAEAAPGVRVVGIDVLDDVLDVARATVTDRGLTDRVTFRHQDVATLSDFAAYDLVYLPAFFLPEDTLTTALPRIRQALRPGGWLVVAGHEPPREPLGRAVDTWRQAAAGCCTWDAAETGRRLASAGFAQVQALQGNPLFPGAVVGTVER
ncbi:SAM-dependent methyltransferase [Geodermatophilus sp. URMC 62]|uniref:SAM-dependent methyltransferase n=1 Tax=Geodermatophilus sp. URMC 62 TaxID=3423414 RepID=UPI00406CA50D